MLLPISALAKAIGVSVGTLRRWDKDGVLKPKVRTAGGHRRYELTDVLHTLGSAQDISDEAGAGRVVVAYARVSSSEQKQDLVRQRKRLEDHLRGDPTAIFITDLGSGLNFKKRGLARLLGLILAGRVSSLVLTHKDRLLRFGFELVEQLVEAFGGKIVILEDVCGDAEEELAKDVLSILTVFSAKLHGRRSHKNQQKAA
jgi:putative resolvase